MSDATFLIWAHMPGDKVQAFTQHIRNFDVANPGCEFRMVADAPDMSLAEMTDALRSIAPNFHFILGKKP